MRDALRWMLAVAVVLLVPVVPFLGLGDSLDRRVAQLLDQSLPVPTAAALVIGVLATDVLLPVPSSVVSTFAGQRLGFFGGTLASWLGMTIGAVAGFWIARQWGRPLAVRLAGRQEYERMERLSQRIGPRVLVLTRAVPVLAEAGVLLFGATRLGWKRFLWPVCLSNLGIAAAYGLLGDWSRRQGTMLVALAASIAVPVLAATIAKVWVDGKKLDGGR